MTRLPPKTDASITVKLTDEADAFVNAATVTGAVYAPSAREIAVNQTLTAVGSGGLYKLAWDGDWTVYNGKVVRGEYLIEVTAVNAGVTRTERFRIPVEWGDTT